MMALMALGSVSATARLSARSAARSAALMRSSTTRTVTTLGATRLTSAAYPVGGAPLAATPHRPASAMTTRTRAGHCSKFESREGWGLKGGGLRE